MRGVHWVGPVSAVSAIVLAVAIASPAQAVTRSPDDDSRVTESTVTVPLQIDCSTVTSVGKADAAVHRSNPCGGLSGAKRGNVVVPDSTSFGNCGSATITMSSAGSGYANIHWNVTSTSGIILVYNVYVAYKGKIKSGSINYSGAFPGTSASGHPEPYTGAGKASAFLGGNVSTLLYDCAVLTPSASYYI
jgi:hypothetical protein